MSGFYSFLSISCISDCELFQSPSSNDFYRWQIDEDYGDDDENYIVFRGGTGSFQEVDLVRGLSLLGRLIESLRENGDFGNVKDEDMQVSMSIDHLNIFDSKPKTLAELLVELNKRLV